MSIIFNFHFQFKFMFSKYYKRGRYKFMQTKRFFISLIRNVNYMQINCVYTFNFFGKDVKIPLKELLHLDNVPIKSTYAPILIVRELHNSGGRPSTRIILFGRTCFGYVCKIHPRTSLAAPKLPTDLDSIPETPRVNCIDRQPHMAPNKERPLN